MDTTANFGTSAAALAFFLGPLAWEQTWLQLDIMDESPAVPSGPARDGAVFQYMDDAQ